MTATKRAQILMEPEDYRRLEETARRREVSVAELIRTAVRDRYLGGGDAAREAVATVCSMGLARIISADPHFDQLSALHRLPPDAV